MPNNSDQPQMAAKERYAKYEKLVAEHAVEKSYYDVGISDLEDENFSSQWDKVSNSYNQLGYGIAEYGDLSPPMLIGGGIWGATKTAVVKYGAIVFVKSSGKKVASQVPKRANGTAKSLGNLKKKPIVEAVAKGIKDNAKKMSSELSESTRLAKSGGRHAGSYNQFSKQTTKQLKKTVKTFSRNIEEHQNWIKNPTSKIPDFYEKSTKHQKNIIHHWKEDIKRHNELQSIAKDILKVKK